MDIERETMQTKERTMTAEEIEKMFFEKDDTPKKQSSTLDIQLEATHMIDELKYIILQEEDNDEKIEQFGSTSYYIPLRCIEDLEGLSKRLHIKEERLLAFAIDSLSKIEIECITKCKQRIKKGDFFKIKTDKYGKEYIGYSDY